MNQREAAKIFINTGSCIEYKSKNHSCNRSRGQCNIVDHRKLVPGINNDKNKQRWDALELDVLELDSNKEKWGFPSVKQSSAGLQT